MTAKERARTIRSCEEKMSVFREKIRELREECRHEEVKKLHSSIHCKGCGISLGWSCTFSPDGVCHYYTEDGKIRLINGTLINPPSTYNCKDGDEYGDECIYCGKSEERK